MSSSEEYLDSLLESILNGGKTDNTSAQQETGVQNAAEGLPESDESKKAQTGAVKANKAMSTEEIEEMLMSMGTLGGEEKSAAEAVDLEEQPMPDDLSLDTISLEEDQSDNSAFDSLGIEEPVSDGLSLEDFSLDDISLDDISLENFGMEDVGAADLSADGAPLEETGREELSLDSPGTDGATSDDMSLDDFSLDDLSLDDMDLEGAGTDDLSLDNLGTEESMANDMPLDDFSLEDLPLDDMMSEGTGTDDLSLDGLGAEDAMSDEMSLDDFSLDDLSLDDMILEGTGADDLSLDGLGTGDVMSDDLSLDNLGAEESNSDGLSIDDLALEDFGSEEATAEEFSLDNLSMGEEMQEEDTLTADMDELDSLMADMDGDLSLDDLSMGEETMSEEDIDRLLSGENLESTESVEMEDDLALSDDFALEESGEEDEDLSALLAGMDHDEDLSEINDLLEKSDQGVPADDDMLAMLGEGDNDTFDFFADDNAAKEAASIREISPEELEERDNPEGKKEKRRRKKKEKKPRKKKGAEEEAQVESGASDGLESLLENAPEEESEKPKKQGFGAKLMTLLFEGDEDENPEESGEEDLLGDGLQMGGLTDENKELLRELSEEDKKNSKKKGKKDKKKKKGKKGQTEEAVEEGEEGEETEQKEKKPKKKKKKKEKSEEEVSSVPEKKLSKKKVITVFLFCGTIAACIILTSSFLPNYLQKNDARVAYDRGYYGDVYDLLYGKKLSEEDESLFQKSSLILQMDRKLASYENYNKMGMRLEALDALLSGVSRYQELLPKAEQYHVSGEVRERYEQIIERLSADFGVSEADALETVASEDDITYSQKVQAIINGTVYGAGEEIPEVKQDVLPEEEEIISRLEDVEQTDGSDN